MKGERLIKKKNIGREKERAKKGVIPVGRVFLEGEKDNC